MAANVLNSQIAIETSIMVVRAFIRAREILAEHLELKRRLDRLEQRVARGFQDNKEELRALECARACCRLSKSLNSQQHFRLNSESLFGWSFEQREYEPETYSERGRKPHSPDSWEESHA